MPYELRLQPETRPVMEPFLVSASEPLPAMLIFPGGGYSHHTRHEGRPVARWLNSLGISAFVVSYRVAPDRHPAPLADGRRAVRLFRYNADTFHLDRQRIGVMGFSADGHLAACVATATDEDSGICPDDVQKQSSRPDLAVLCYPVISFVSHVHEGSLKNLLGDNPDESVRRALSCETRVTAATPPVFLWHTVEDASVPVENSLLFARALRKAGKSFALHLFEEGRPGLGIRAVRLWRLCS